MLKVKFSFFLQSLLKVKFFSAIKDE